MRSGPETASAYPGKFSTSDVSWSCACRGTCARRFAMHKGCVGMHLCKKAWVDCGASLV